MIKITFVSPADLESVDDRYIPFAELEPTGPLIPAQHYVDPFKATILSLDAIIQDFKKDMSIIYTQITTDEPFSFSSKRGIVKLFNLQRRLYAAQKARLRIINEKEVSHA